MVQTVALRHQFKISSKQHTQPLTGYEVGLVRGEGPWKTAVLVLLLLFFGPDFGGFFAAVPAAQLSALRADPRRTKDKQYRLFA